MAEETKIMLIGPVIAAEMLKKNLRNRKISEEYVNRLVNEMRNDRWVFNGDSICFGDDGFLLDGQHRLTAIIKSGTQQKCNVVTGIKDSYKVFPTIDHGKSRSLGDALYVDSAKSYSGHIASAIKIVYRYKHVTNFSRSTKYITTSDGMFVEYYRNNPGIKESFEYVKEYYTQSRAICPFSMIIAMHHLASLVDSTDANIFIHSLVTGYDLQEGDPIYALREKLFLVGRKGVRNLETVRMKLLCKTWNYMREKRKITQIRISEDMIMEQLI